MLLYYMRFKITKDKHMNAASVTKHSLNKINLKIICGHTLGRNHLTAAYVTKRS